MSSCSLRTLQDDGPGLPATLRRAQVVGPTVRLELVRQDTGDVLAALLDARTWRETGVQLDDAALVVPRRLRVFGP